MTRNRTCRTYSNLNTLAGFAAAPAHIQASWLRNGGTVAGVSERGRTLLLAAATRRDA